jgi:hypothetical protein
MARPRDWKPLPVKSLDRAIYGPVFRALRHSRQPNVLLLHLKFVSRNHPRYDQSGMWSVIVDGIVVRRRIYWFKEISKPPTRWANKILRLHADGVFAREAAEEKAKAEADEREWAAVQAKRGKADASPLTPLTSPLSEPFVDDRRKRHRSVVNYHLPARFDELPSKHVPIRSRTMNGMLRRYRTKRKKCRR